MALSSTARDIISDALTELGVLAAGDTMSADDAKDGLTAFNRMLDTMRAERLIIYTFTRTTFTITSGTGQYNVASGETVNIARPVYLENDAVRYQDTSLSSTTEFPLKKLTESEWRAIGVKTMESTLPTSWYYNPAFATGTLDFWPVPTSSTLQGVVYSPTGVAQVAGLSTSVSLPPGYEEMLVKNLAVRLAPAYERQVDAGLLASARELKAIVKRANFRLKDMSFEPASLIGGAVGYDIKLS